MSVSRPSIPTCCSISEFPQIIAVLACCETRASSVSASVVTESRKTGIRERIIHVAEHHVLPDQQTKLVA